MCIRVCVVCYMYVCVVCVHVCVHDLYTCVIMFVCGVYVADVYACEYTWHGVRKGGQKRADTWKPQYGCLGLNLDALLGQMCS